jgi:OmpA-OmpF porin, OOP family
MRSASRSLAPLRPCTGPSTAGPVGEVSPFILVSSFRNSGRGTSHGRPGGLPGGFLVTLKATHILPYALTFPRAYRPALLAGLGFFLGAPAAAQTPAVDVPAVPVASTPALPEAAPGTPVVQLVPGSPPPGPSTLGNAFVDAANARLSQALFGGLGTLSVSSADIGRKGLLRFAAFGQYYDTANWPAGGEQTSRTAGLVAVDFVPLDFLELYATISTATATSTTDTTHRAASTDGDFGLGAKLAWRLSPAFALAVDVRGAHLAGVGTAPASHRMAPYVLFAWTPPWPLRLGVQLGAQFQWNSVPLSYPTGGAEVALSSTAYNQLLAGLSLEFPLPIVTPFFEYTTGYPLDVPGGTLVGLGGLRLPIHAALPHQMNAGLKFTLVENLTLLVAGQFSLQSSVAVGVPAIPPWNVVFAATYVVDLFPTPATRLVVQHLDVPRAAPSTTFAVAGVVVDAATQAPLGAVVVTVDGGRESPVASDAAGHFLTRPLPPGPVRLRLVRDGYQDALVEAVVQPEEAPPLRAALTPLPPRARFLLSTTVQRRPVAAHVTLTGAETQVVDTQAGAAPTRVTVLPGAYLAEVTAEGYLAQLREVEVSAGAELQLAFDLQSAPKRKHVVLREDRLELLVQVHFAPGSAVLVADSYPLLDEVVDAVVRLSLKRVRVEGYTDSSGSHAANLRLSQARAEAVTDYLVQRGVPRDRLEAKGYAEARPLAPNLTARGRELNRRVEIVVLEK